MPTKVIVMMIEAIIMYFLVLGAHSLRRRYGPAHFYAVLGGIAAVMSWVTDAGLAVDVVGIRFMLGSTVFYTSLLLGIFVVYVFDGPRATRIAISTVAGVSAMVPLLAAALHFHMSLGGVPPGGVPPGGGAPLAGIPQPSLRINTASVVTTLLDLVFLGVAWEALGKPALKLRLWLRTWLTLLGVMWLDVLLFATFAFAGTPQYLNIMRGTLVSRFIISLFALPFLYGYLHWQSNRKGVTLQNRPVLAILREVAEMEAELSLAEEEIEKRKEVEAALRESKGLLDATGELANVGGWQVDLPSREVRWTEQTRHICEIPEGSVPSLDMASRFFKPDDRERLAEARERAIEHGEPYDLELEFVTAKGRHRWIRTLCRPRVVEGETLGLLGALQDVTERKMMEEQLRRQERMAAVGQMAAGIAHDFRNRVNAILLYAEMALDRHSLPSPVEGSLETIIHESRGIADLVQQILDFSGQSMVNLDPLDLAELIQQTADRLRAQLPTGVAFTIEREPTSYVVEADGTRILQALDNLVSNSCDAMPEGGRLSITLARIEHPSEHPSSDSNGPGELPDDLSPGEWVRLSVSDTGTGMTEQVHQHLFEPFFTTKDVGEGTGLGLAQVYGIVRQHEGSVTVETALGEGTTVHIFLPAYTDASPDPSDTASSQDPQAAVLLVEPNDSLRHAERKLLESLGYRVLVAKHGRDALALTQSPRWSGTRSNRVDLVLTTLEMPSMSGRELMKELTRTRPYLKAVAVSGRGLEEDEVTGLKDAGFVAAISKPLEIDALERVLSTALGDG